MLCACGTFIKRNQVRCRKCAVDYAAGFDTDAFDLVRPQQQPEVEPVMTEAESDLNQPQQMSKDDIVKWNQFQQEMRFNAVIKKIAIGFVIFTVIVCLAVAIRIWK